MSLLDQILSKQKEKPTPPQSQDLETANCHTPTATSQHCPHCGQRDWWIDAYRIRHCLWCDPWPANATILVRDIDSQNIDCIALPGHRRIDGEQCVASVLVSRRLETEWREGLDFVKPGEKFEEWWSR